MVQTIFVRLSFIFFGDSKQVDQNRSRNPRIRKKGQTRYVKLNKMKIERWERKILWSLRKRLALISMRIWSNACETGRWKLCFVSKVGIVLGDSGRTNELDEQLHFLSLFDTI